MSTTVQINISIDAKPEDLEGLLATLNNHNVEIQANVTEIKQVEPSTAQKSNPVVVATQTAQELNAMRDRITEITGKLLKNELKDEARAGIRCTGANKLSEIKDGDLETVLVKLEDTANEFGLL